MSGIIWGGSGGGTGTRPGPLPRGRLCAREAGVRHVVYGHLHGEVAGWAFEGERDGLTSRCTSADHLNFAPANLFQHNTPPAATAN